MLEKLAEKFYPYIKASPLSCENQGLAHLSMNLRLELFLAIIPYEHYIIVLEFSKNFVIRYVYNL